MSFEDPGEPPAPRGTPAWPPVPSDDASSIPTPFRADDLEGEIGPDEEFEQFDWDSWEPGAVAEGDDDGPKAEEVDWSAWDPPDLADAVSWREKVIGSGDWAKSLRDAEPKSAEIAPAGQAPSNEQDGSPEPELPPLPTTLAEPLLASGKPWPPASSVNHDVVHVRVAPWAPFATGIALALAMVLASAALVSQTGRLGLTLAVLTGQVPTSADAVVEAYLTAISEADAQKAMSYLSSAPTNQLLLSDSVLLQSIHRAPLTIIDLTPAAGTLSGTERVDATYTIGGERVSTTFTTGFGEGRWMIRDAPASIGVGSLRAAGIPLYINGQRIPDTVDSLPAFPGTYELSTGNDLIAFASPSTIVVRSPDEAPTVGAVRLELTDAGTAAAQAAVRNALTACLAATSLQPDACPQHIEANPDQPVLPETIRYSVVTESGPVVTGSELNLSQVTLKYAAKWRIDVQVLAKGAPQSLSYEFDVMSLWKVTLSDTPVKVELIE